MVRSVVIDHRPPIRLLTLSIFTLQMAGYPASPGADYVGLQEHYQGCLDVSVICNATRQRDYVCKLHVKRHAVRRDTTARLGLDAGTFALIMKTLERSQMQIDQLVSVEQFNLVFLQCSPRNLNVWS